MLRRVPTFCKRTRGFQEEIKRSYAQLKSGNLIYKIFYYSLQWSEYLIYSQLRFQDVSTTEIVLEEGTISYGGIPLGSKEAGILFKITVGCAVPNDQEEVASVVTHCSSGALVQTRGVSCLSLASPLERYNRISVRQ